MNAVLENIYTRRSVRSYKPDPVPEEFWRRSSRPGFTRPAP